MLHTTRFQLGVDTKAIVEHLILTTVGQQIPYIELSQLIGHDIQQPKYRSCLSSARRILVKEHNMVFGTIRNVGIQRLADTEIVREGDLGIKKVRRSCRRTAGKVICANYNTLSQDDKNKHNLSLSVLGAITHVTSIKEQRKIGNAVSKAASEIDHSMLLEICKTI